MKKVVTDINKPVNWREPTCLCSLLQGWWGLCSQFEFRWPRPANAFLLQKSTYFKPPKNNNQPHVVFHNKIRCFFITDPRYVGDKVIYSQIDMTRKTSSPAAGLGSVGHCAASSGNKSLGNHGLTVQGNGNGARDPASFSTVSSDSDPLSWAPLLGNRNQQESSLWKIAIFMLQFYWIYWTV